MVCHRSFCVSINAQIFDHLDVCSRMPCISSSLPYAKRVQPRSHASGLFMTPDSLRVTTKRRHIGCRVSSPDGIRAPSSA